MERLPLESSADAVLPQSVIMETEILPRGSEGRVRIVKITRDGGESGWSALGNAMKKLAPSGFVSIDTEFSGLGNDPLLMDADMSVRYEAMRAVVDSGAVLSLGISVFNPCDATVATGSSPDAKQTASYEVATFDFCMCCETPWSVSADSARFLVSHSFDFNRLFAAGIPYVRASTEKSDPAKSVKEEVGSAVVKRSLEALDCPFNWGPLPRGLLWRLGRAAAPIVLHNGLMDLVFIFSAFHGPLPATLNLFVAALLDSVPAGFYDTKHLASTVKPERASFLSFVYAKAVQEGSVRVVSSAGLPRAEVASPEDFVHSSSTGSIRCGSWVDANLKPAEGAGVCLLYGLRGHCPKGSRCLFSHDAFDVLAYERTATLPDIKSARKGYKKQQKIAAQAKWSEEAKRKRPSDMGDALSTEALGKESKKKRLSKKALRRSMEGLRAANETKLSSDLHGEEPLVSSKSSVEGAKGSHLEGARALSTSDHNAGWDAYMTGFCFAAARAGVESKLLEKERNKLPLAKKATPLLLCRSSFDELNARTLTAEAKLTVGVTDACQDDALAGVQML